MDTVVNLDSEKKQIILKIPFKSSFEHYSSSVFLTQGDTIDIDYQRKVCCGGNCCNDRDRMHLYKNKDGSYFARYFETLVKAENCIDYDLPTVGEMQLTREKSDVINDYFRKNNIPYQENKIVECIVRIGRHIYIMNKGTYEIFRKRLFN